MKKILTLLVVCLPVIMSAQNPNVTWKPGTPLKQDLQLLHSTHCINLNTAETLQAGDWEFEVSHRFVPPITEGQDAFWGIDGPVKMRLALGYAPTNKMVFTIGRTNLQDNLDLQWKYKAIQIKNTLFPLLIGVQGGVAYNAQLGGEVSENSKKVQYYGQIILNTLIKEKLGLGVVPSYLHNSYIYCMDIQYSFNMGGYVQYYVSPVWSVLAEWIPTVTGWRRTHNTFSFGIELETGGHFFKIVLTNNDTINPSQHLAGADLDFNSGDWRIGFMITRLLSFN
ncbi:hypothetical protein JW935_25420 [candidate division KSB1 bacterium]|nr:hypothetical protein [candidate division KSB1 bacterium]